jgi:hypothetical protein
MLIRYSLVLCLLFSVSVNAQIVINEICSANGDITHETDFFNFPGWVEIYNKGSVSVDIGGYYLTDDASQNTKWRIPNGTVVSARGYRVVWCDDRNTGLHTNFKLDSDGEELVLSNSALAELDRVTYPKQYTNISYGRIEDGGSAWGYLSQPTPAARNNSATGSQRLANPVFGLKAGRYSGTQSISMTHPSAGAEVRYTTDGSEPTLSSAKYSTPVPVSKTTTIKAKAFLQGFLPSKTEVKTYFINEHAFTLPVVSLSLRPQYLWDNTIGIYGDGTNGKTGNCTNRLVNWNQDWDRHAAFEYFDKNGSKFFDQQVDIRIGGGCSRNNPQKSLVVKARDKYGSSTFDHDFFKTKDITRFGGFVLRNSGNDFYNTMFRDALMQSLTIDQMDIDYLAYQPTIAYLNGNYWGILNLREKIDGDYIEANYGIDKSDVDLIESWGNVIEGSNTHYNMYLDSLQKIDLTSEKAYQFINRYIDAQEFINYLTAQIYYCNTDWPGNNVKFWRQRSDNGRYRWILWDLDFGFGLYAGASYATHPTLEFATQTNGPGWPNPPWSTLHIRLLLQNPTFREKFIQTFTTALSTTFRPQRVVNVIDDFQKNIKDEMPFHLSRWNLSASNWNNEVQRLKSFAQERNDYMKGHLRSFFGLTDDVRFHLQAIPAGSGAVVMNGITSSDPVSDAFYYKGLPFEISASAAPGYEFSHFTVAKREATAVPLIAQGDEWRYFDKGSIPATDWAGEGYEDGGWATGKAQLGYGDGDEQTIVSYGGDPANKYITTYFRKTITVSDTVGLESLSGRVLFDDGVVVYLNGEEVFRNNLPAGPVNYNTLALDFIQSENIFYAFSIPRGKLKPGKNVISAEVHQNSASSSDISFDLSLSTYKTGAQVEYTTNEAVFTDIASSDVVVKAYYEPVMVSHGIVINEFSASNKVYEDPFGGKDDWIELYNTGNEAIDLAGFYITDNLSNKTKHLIKKGVGNETVIAPGAYKILWADEEVNQGPLHLNFKLSADGESIGLYQQTGTDLVTMDEITFAAQSGGTSYSRIPNATGPFMVTTKITPLAENELELPTGVEETLSSLVHVYPNPTGTDVVLESARKIDGVRIYSSSGMLLYNTTSVISGDVLPLGNAPSGLYLIIISVEGKSIQKRIIRH